MPRIDIELTSSRPDGTWTWRAAGARQPKGVVDASVLHQGAKVGDVVRAEADFDLDGINVTSVLAPKTKKAGPELLPLLGSGKEEALVTHSPLKPEREGGDRGRRGDRGDRGERGERGERRDRADRFGGPGGGPGGRPGGPGGPGATRPRASAGPSAGPREGARREGGGSGPRERARPDRPERPRAERPDGDRPPRGDRPQRERAPRPAASAPPSRPRPQAKRLQPGRAHREAVLSGLPPEQRAIAEQVLRGGLPGVRQAVEEQNAKAREAGGPEIKADGILSLAEELLPGLMAAEWRDRAEAAVASIDEISLRDLRTVVAGADAAGRDEASRALATQVREGLERRSAAERQAWVDEIGACLDESRVVRALRVSGRAPEQGLRLPPELNSRLTEAAAEAMGPETAPDRWLALLEAVLASPVRRAIAPKGLPAGADEATRTTVRQAIPKVPALAPLLGESPSNRPVPPPPPRRPAAPPPRPAPAPASAAPPPAAAVEPAPVPEQTATGPGLEAAPLDPPIADLVASAAEPEAEPERAPEAAAPIAPAPVDTAAAAPIAPAPVDTPDAAAAAPTAPAPVDTADAPAAAPTAPAPVDTAGEDPVREPPAGDPADS